MSLQSRLEKAFDVYGEQFFINGTTSAKGFFQTLDQSRINTYFDSIEAAYIVKPAMMLLVPASTSLAVNNTVQRDGRTYTIKKIWKSRFKNSVIMQNAVLT
jgi:hypothetical protein